jgi:small subunit ribosomal protein S8
MLTRIRNAIQVRHESVLVPSSKLKVAIAKILKEEGYIRDYDMPRGHAHPTLRIHLSYREGRVPAITGLKRVSKPGLRSYVGKGEIPRVYGGLGVAILSTSQGVMAGRQAWRQGTGGELLCYVW